MRHTAKPGRSACLGRESARTTRRLVAFIVASFSFLSSAAFSSSASFPYSLPSLRVPLWLGLNRASAREDLSGTYVLLQQTATLTPLPILKDVVAKTRSVVILQLKQEGARLSGQGKLCELSLTSSSKMVKTTLPPALLRLVAQVPFDASFKTRDGETTLDQRPSTLVLGASLKNKTEPLPETYDDPRVVDQDRDGYPGVTVGVSGIVSGDVYLVQRSTSRIYGKGSAGQFTGSIAHKTDQAVLGASSRFLKTSLKSRPLPEASRFVMKKASSSVTCAEASQMARPWTSEP